MYRLWLQKRGNFTVIPKELPKEQIIGNIESALQEEHAEIICTENSGRLRKAPAPKKYLTRSMKELNLDKTILILSADKRNATVVLNTKEYENTIRELLDPTRNLDEIQHDQQQRSSVE